MAIFNMVGGGGGQPIEIKDWLCFTANTASSTVKLNKTGTPTTVTLETSTDYGQTWSTYTFGDTITLTNVGDKVYWRNTSETTTGFSSDYSNRYTFSMSGSINASGDVNFLLNKNSTDTLTELGCFYGLFYGCSSLKVAPSLPALTLSKNCYERMFWNSGIKYAPELPSTSLQEYCYAGMFMGCSSLIVAPTLPATNLGGRNVYQDMFHTCTNLVTIPQLPALVLTFACYASMFYGCSKIRLSTTQTGDYQTAYRIPKVNTGTTASRSLNQMFDNTGGTFTGTPSINTTYYTSNPLV